MFIIEIEPRRALTSINYNFIGFNVSGWKKFSSKEEAQEFIDTWKRLGHFFNFNYVEIVERPDKED